MSQLHFGLTEAITLAIIVIGFAADGILRQLFGDKFTISDRWAVWSMRYPILSALLGVLLGHLCWPNRGYCP